MNIAVDFDGTVVTHAFPDLGVDIGAVPVLLDIVAQGHNIILHTMRSGKQLQVAEKWFQDNGIPLYGVNEDPDQHTWTKSPKAYADIYIDDSGIGTPLTINEKLSPRAFVNWIATRRLLEKRGVFVDTIPETE